MARRPQDVTDAELEVLRALWDLGPATIRTLADRLYPGGGASEYATVQKLLERLEDKGHVAHEAESRQNVYSARVARDALVARRLRETADQLCDGSLTPLLTHLVSAGRLSPHELRELRRLVDRLSRER
ncbi:MAG: BlaI/MecI/CopY family transcriptional regulator [Betaproteobacteria bacterium]